MPSSSRQDDNKAYAGADVLRLTGPLTIDRATEVEAQINAACAGGNPPRQVDLSGVEEIDTVGAWLVHRLRRDHPDTEIIHANERAELLLAEVRAADHPVKIRADRAPLFLRELSQVGIYIVDTTATAGAILGFIGLTIAGGWRAIRYRAGLKLASIAVQMEQTGVRALGIIGLMTFLVGIVIAQQGAVQLKQFGAEALVVNLIGRLTFRELGVLITAILVAGRSASAFAAQIGSMKLAEEIDAMRTIGLDPVRVLVLPRVIALIVVMPLLTFFGSILSIIGGGLFCWISMDMPPTTYVERIREVVPMLDFLHGMLKAPVFGAIIAIIGCFQGFQVTGNAESVGERTTAAVVQSIFLVIVLDAFFAIFFTALGLEG
ncbi:MAG: MlaE family lipid ABC transporter permease subunit [Sphingomonadaceae bacterium]